MANVKRGFNRLFAVLTAVWITYCLIVYPLQRQAQASKIEKTEFLSCWHESTDMKGCMDYARLKAGTDRWSLRAFYTRESWFLALVVVGVPLLAYGCCRVLAWVWRGFNLG
jgi:hypothetical protein